MAPYTSQAQRGKFHILEKQGKIAPSTVKEFDQASKGKKLPYKVKEPKAEAGKLSKMMGGK